MDPALPHQQHKAPPQTGSIPEIVKWRRHVLYFRSKGLIDDEMVVRCFLLAEGATTGTLALKGKGHKTHWTEEQIASVWGLSARRARPHLRKLLDLDLLGFWRGNKRQPAERWLLLPERDHPPPNWPWGAPSPDAPKRKPAGLSEDASDREGAGLSPDVSANESGRFGAKSKPESDADEIEGVRTFRSDVSVAEPNGSRHGVPTLSRSLSVETSADNEQRRGVNASTKQISTKNRGSDER